MADRPGEPGINPFSRRDFLKLAGAGALSVVLSGLKINQALTTGAVIDTLINPDSSVTIKQRKHKFEEVLVKSVSEPKLLPSFLKFVALEVYANTQNYIVAKNTIRQFIYGEGINLDVTNFLAESYRKSPGWLDGDFDPISASDGTILQAFSEEIVGRSIFIKEKDPRNTETKIHEKDGIVYLEGTGDSLNADTVYGIKQFRYIFEGKRSSDGSIDGRFSLCDKYDWDNRHSDSGSLTKGAALDIMCEYLVHMGIPDPKEWIRSKMGEDEFTKMSSDGFISIDDEDGLRLQQSGIGESFNVTAEWNIRRMKLNIPEN